MKTFILTLVLLCPISTFAVAQQKSTNDPLKPYTRCKLPGGLKVMEVGRAKYDGKTRTVKTANGMENVSVIDGYRVMFSYEDLWYYFANVKIEASDPAKYDGDKATIISSLKYFANTKQATGIVYAERSELNGFEHYGIDRDQIDIGGQVGTHALFDDRHHLVITIYFLNQDNKNLFRATASGPRRFTNIQEYQQRRDDFLGNYSECLAEVAATNP